MRSILERVTAEGLVPVVPRHPDVQAQGRAHLQKVPLDLLVARLLVGHRLQRDTDRRRRGKGRPDLSIRHRSLKRPGSIPGIKNGHGDVVEQPQREDPGPPGFAVDVRLAAPIGFVRQFHGSAEREAS